MVAITQIAPFGLLLGSSTLKLMDFDLGMVKSILKRKSLLFIQKDILYEMLTKDEFYDFFSFCIRVHI